MSTAREGNRKGEGVFMRFLGLGMAPFGIVLVEDTDTRMHVCLSFQVLSFIFRRTTQSCEAKCPFYSVQYVCSGLNFQFLY